MWRGEVDNLCVFTDVNAKPKAGDTRVLCHDKPCHDLVYILGAFSRL